VRALADKNINILALSLADTADFGILRLIVSDPDTGAATLKKAGFTVVTNDVLASRSRTSRRARPASGCPSERRHQR